MKKVVRNLVLGAALGFSALGFVQSNASAASNHTDTSYEFIFEDWTSNSYDNTAARPKFNATSAYMNSQVVGGDYLFKGHVQEATGIDVSGGNIYTFGDNTVHKLINFAYERYGYGVMVEIKGTMGWHTVQVKASGLWSPDSI